MQDGGSGLERASVNGVHVFDVQNASGTARAEFIGGVGEFEHGIADLQLRVHDGLGARAVHAEFFLRAEGYFEEFDQIGRASDGKILRERVEAFRDGIHRRG